MWNAIGGIVLILAMPQVAGALAGWRLGWRGPAVLAWPLLAAADSAVTSYVYDRIQAAEAAAAGHYVCGTGAMLMIVFVPLFHAVVGTILALGARLTFGRGEVARG